MAKYFMKCRVCGSTDFKYLKVVDGLFVCSKCDIEIEPHNVFYELEKIENNVIYEDAEHRNRVLKLLEQYSKIYSKYNNQVDLEYYPAYYLLSMDMMKDKALKYIDDDGIDFTEMVEKEDFSTSQKLIIKLAQQLFNSGEDVSIVDLLGSLDDKHWELVLQAIKLRRRALNLEDI